MWRWSVCTKRQECQQEGSRSTDAGVPTSLAKLVSIVAKFERIFSRSTLSLPRGETKSPCWRFATVETKSNNDCTTSLEPPVRPPPLVARTDADSKNLAASARCVVSRNSTTVISQRQPSWHVSRVIVRRFGVVTLRPEPLNSGGCEPFFTPPEEFTT